MDGAAYSAYWVSNAIHVETGDYFLAQLLARDPAVHRIFAPVEYAAPEPIDREARGSRLGAQAPSVVEWGVSNIKADQVWKQYGVRGDGIVVASIDSGVQFDHPALVDSYRGYDAATGQFDNDYNWLDVSGISEFPTDGNGHGTHTMGTMVGDDGGANQIGVAPGARWIAANGCCPSDQALVESAQWMLAPTRVDGTAPDPAQRPNIINNSWGSPAVHRPVHGGHPGVVGRSRDLRRRANGNPAARAAPRPAPRAAVPSTTRSGLRLSNQSRPSPGAARAGRRGQAEHLRAWSAGALVGAWQPLRPVQWHVDGHASRRRRDRAAVVGAAEPGR